jgi:hypothetical protein
VGVGVTVPITDKALTWTYDKDDSTYDAPCPACGEGPLDLKGYGMVCPSGHIIEENNA